MLVLSFWRNSATNTATNTATKLFPVIYKSTSKHSKILALLQYYKAPKIVIYSSRVENISNLKVSTALES